MISQVDQYELSSLDDAANKYAEALTVENGIDPGDCPEAMEHFRGQFCHEIREWHVALLGIEEAMK